MSSDPPTDRENWTEQDELWEAQGSLPHGKYAEVEFYLRQDRLRIEREKRREDFEQDMRQRKQVFVQTEVRSRKDLVNQVVRRIWVCYILGPVSGRNLTPFSIKASKRLEWKWFQLIPS
jgi:hypothetical protein